jgi:arginine/lysine/ornithine decarboxylase
VAIKDFLLEHAGLEPVSFHMPGHKGSAIYRENGYGDFLDNVMDCDITEIPGADNLFQTESIIAETMEKYRKLYNVEKSYLLVNGSSSGLIAAILASVGRGGKLIMARNCHKSIFNALGLADIRPVYAYPEVLEEYGVLGGITATEVARCLAENSDAEAVIIPSPNYYGITSDISQIADVVHAAGKILIVDQAHGAHLKFFSKYGVKGFPKAAEDQGADLVINSIHKTLASWTQSALLNVCSDRVDLLTLEDKLQTIESSSPSYPMMASLDINADLLTEKGESLMREWAENLDWFYSEVKKIPGVIVMEDDSLDHTKINIDMSAYGIDGNEVEELLMEKGIFLELVTGNIIMCMGGIGNKRQDYERLLEGLKDIAVNHKLAHEEKMQQPPALTIKLDYAGVPRSKVIVPIDEAAGRVCASSLIPYPPGVPIACPGEVITQEVIDFVKARRAADEKVIGITSDGKVQVGA